MSSAANEVNFDGIVGPTHNYAGLSFGNRASMKSAGAPSNPRLAARQGLAKMRILHELGPAQGVLPPPQRPDPTALGGLGVGHLAPVDALTQLSAVSPALLATAMSASSMWAANAATVSPSADCADGRVHLTPANLVSTAHRSFESVQTRSMLSRVFADPERFVVHDALPAAAAFADEGAANHSRLARSHCEAGVEMFVFGAEPGEAPTLGFPRRQSRLASALVARSHGLAADRTMLVRQSPVAIDSGAFHNDVVAVANESVLFAHEGAFADRDAVRRDLPEWVELIEVPEAEVPLDDAIASYLFNAQLLTVPSGRMLLVAPGEVAETPSTGRYVEQLVASSGPIGEVRIVDLRQSMRNGGGPACVRLRVVLTESEQAALSGRVIVDDTSLDALEGWVDRHYRDELRPDDLRDHQFIDETCRALDELTQLLDLPELYPFQR
ncbi:MAG: N-succinylarginine dihydrolase [Actinomycetota bacterium]|nr:N-succinylarginine dihydrolase [Actinomycetota bacterium]